MTLADASAVRRSDDTTWEAEVQPGWDIAGNANGGYLLAIAARALAGATGRPDPVSVTAHYLSPAAPGPVIVDTQVLRTGRRFATASAVLRRDAKPLLAVLGSYSDLGGGVEVPERVRASPPTLPPPSSCVAVEATDTFPPPFMGKVELRLHPEDAGFAVSDDAGSAGGGHTRGTSGKAVVRGWFRLPDGEPLDTVAVLLATDAFPPTIFNARLPVAWTPTLELTAHVRARPAPGWLRCSFRTRFVTGGFLEEDGEVWDDAGRLVGQSRQLALLPRG